MKVVIVDNGGANITSLRFALQRCGYTGVLSGDPVVVRAADRVILPGVGAAASAMQRMDAALIETLRTLSQPVLGICLGMQLLFSYSEEGDTSCLSVVPGRVTALPSALAVVPHMGWNTVSYTRSTACPLLRGVPQDAYFYFVHSYCVPATCEYAVAWSTAPFSFCAVLQKDNFYGCQFHPEKSSQHGARLLSNFLEYA